MNKIERVAKVTVESTKDGMFWVSAHTSLGLALSRLTANEIMNIPVGIYENILVQIEKETPATRARIIKILPDPDA